jgi:hypothetical protein
MIKGISIMQNNKETRMKQLITIVIIATVTGCCSLQKPAEGITSTVFPEYRSYVANDANLTEAQKKRRLHNADAFEKLVEKGK